MTLSGISGLGGLSGMFGAQADEEGFSPSDVPGLNLWMRADTGVTSAVNSDPVSAWVSKEGNGHTFVQGTAAKQPVYLESAINGQPGIQFDGTDDFLEISSGLLSDTNGTFFILLQTMGGDGLQRDMYSQSVSGTVSNYFIIRYDQNQKFSFQTRNLGSATAESLVGNTVLTEPHILTLTHNDTSAQMRVDGADESETGTSSKWVGDVVGYDKTTIGAWQANVPITHVNGVLCELMHYTPVLNSVRIGLIETYLSDRYSISIP